MLWYIQCVKRNKEKIESVVNNKKAKIWNAEVWKAKDEAALSGDRVADMMDLLGF